MPLLEVTDLFYSYGRNQVLRGISLTIDQTGLVGLIGANGSGKSTLLKNMSGHYRPKRGQVKILGRPASQLSIQEKAWLIGYIPQDLPHEFDFTGYDIVMMGRTPYLRRFQNETELDRQIVREAMEKTETWSLCQRPVSQLSGGERQRIYIARALAQNPKIMLLDEPISHLDIKYQVEILKLLKDLTTQGILVLTVLHDINLAAQFCDDIILLHEGQVFAHGCAREVINKENINQAFNVTINVLQSPERNPYIVPIVSNG